jgi:hypothetical protein
MYFSRFLMAAAIACVFNSGAVRASEPTVAWERQTQSVTVTPDLSGVTQNFQIEIPQVMRWQERVETIVNENRLVEVEGWCDGLDCPDSGNGKSPAWDRYFSAPGNAKTRALADAIKGVGEVSAEKLIRGGFFHSKPRSWKAFVAEIDRAVSGGAIDSRVRYEVVVRYRSENVENLGYAAGACRPYSYRCMKWENRLVPVPRVSFEDRHRVLQTHMRSFNLTVNNSRLQHFESEKVEVTAGLETDDVSVQAGPFNLYQRSISHNGNVTDVVLTGIKRNFVAIPKGVVLGAFVVKQGGPNLSLAVDAKYIPAPGTTDRLLLRYVVEGCKLSFTGYCTFSKYKAVDQGEAQVTQPTSLIALKVPANHKVRVRYAVARLGSSWYDGTYSEEQVTPDFKVD